MSSRPVKVTFGNATQVLRGLLKDTEFETSTIRFMGKKNHKFYFLVEVLMEEDDFGMEEFDEPAIISHVKRVISFCRPVSSVSLHVKDLHAFADISGMEIIFAGITLQALI